MIKEELKAKWLAVHYSSFDDGNAVDELIDEAYQLGYDAAVNDVPISHKLLEANEG